jgi:antitoxin component HigA of HigAB toxin-antitoxin module
MLVFMAAMPWRRIIHSFPTNKKMIQMKNIILTFLGIVLVSLMVSAQQGKEEDPIAQSFFSPELVMQNQQALGLTETQRANIQKEIQSAQSEFMTWQWDLQKEMEKFKSMISKENLSEAEVAAQLEHVLTIENMIKKRQILLLTRIKNYLSHDQQEKLKRIRQG